MWVKIIPGALNMKFRYVVIFNTLLLASGLTFIGYKERPHVEPMVDPIEIVTVVEIGQCTEAIPNWFSSQRSKCAVKLSNGKFLTLSAPVMVGMSVATLGDSK
jgi:hypothetical protein